MKWFAIWRTEFRGYIVAEILLQAVLGSPACVAWYRVVWPDILPPCRARTALFLQARNVGLHVECKAI